MQLAETVFQNLFNTNLQSIEGENLAEQAALNFPYFSPAHFFVAKQKQNEKNLSKALLYFNNPFLLHFTLNKKQQDAKEIIEPVALEQNENIEPIIFPELKIEKATIDNTLVFEPLHTSDYFASQGIKISKDISPNDKLGRQLKSFTEWLKTMKKVIPTNENTAVSTQDNFHPVLTMAEKSNSNANVITESMAEILAEQGKKPQAIEIYEKLSLLNPSKSAYFAAKIEQLKAN